MELPGNADDLEIERFDQVSETWWDPQGEMGTLHTINPLRVRFIAQDISLANQLVLDIGCGGGILAEAMARAGARVTGIDLSKASISVARRHAQSQGLSVQYHCASVEDIAGEHPESYDIVTCMEMLEHVPKPELVIAGCARVLKPGGRAYFSTINRSLKALLFAIWIGEHILHLLPRGSHTYRKLIQPQELIAWGEKNGMEFTRIASLMYNPFTRGFKLDDYKADVNYLAQFTKRN